MNETVDFVYLFEDGNWVAFGKLAIKSRMHVFLGVNLESLEDWNHFKIANHLNRQ